MSNFREMADENHQYMVPRWLKKFLNGPASFWDLFSSYLAQSSYLVWNTNVILLHRVSKEETQEPLGKRVFKPAVCITSIRLIMQQRMSWVSTVSDQCDTIKSWDQVHSSNQRMIKFNRIILWAKFFLTSWQEMTMPTSFLLTPLILHQWKSLLAPILWSSSLLRDESQIISVSSFNAQETTIFKHVSLLRILTGKSRTMLWNSVCSQGKIQFKFLSWHIWQAIVTIIR